ncbi:MAG: lipoyl synthase [Planctomycetes bacterium]|nr:lipoyl synthase [Planctomycetota bacterium]
MLNPSPDTDATSRRKPAWLKVRAPSGEEFTRLKALRRDLSLSTVCEEARCPNIGECWASGTATFMLMGDTCTRHCRFCNVKTGNPRGRLDGEEPARIAEAVRVMDLGYVVLTMVDRDDLPDGGAAHVNACVAGIRAACPRTKVELLMGDFRARPDLLAELAHGGAEVLAHNLETVEPLTKTVRDGKSGYRRSLESLRLLKAAAPRKLTKSSIMLGLGETAEQVQQTLTDLRAVGVNIVTFGQYLQPSPRHLPVHTFVPPDVFDAWKQVADGMGFLFCASGPLVRSSYKAGEIFTEQYLRERELDEATTGG